MPANGRWELARLLNGNSVCSQQSRLSYFVSVFLLCVCVCVTAILVHLCSCIIRVHVGRFNEMEFN